MLFKWKNLIFDDFFSYSWHINFLCHGIKYPIFPPSKMPINYLYSRNIKEFLLFMPGIYTKDLRYFLCLKINYFVSRRWLIEKKINIWYPKLKCFLSVLKTKEPNIHASNCGRLIRKTLVQIEESIRQSSESQIANNK